jgi:hypothetical protein
MTRLRRLAVLPWVLRWSRIPLLLVISLLAVLSVLGAGPTSAEVATNIVTVLLMVIAPFLPLAHLHLSGPQMVLASMASAFIVAIAAQLITGDLKTSDLQGGIGPLLFEFGKLWAIEQGVFQLLKDSPTVGPLLTTKPLLASPAAPAAP